MYQDHLVDPMSFLAYLGTFAKRVVFFVCGFIVAFPVAGTIGMVGAKTVKSGYLNTIEYNPIATIFTVVVFIIGLAMMFYAFNLKE